MIPSDVAIVAKPKIKGIITAHEKPKAAISSIKARIIATTCPRLRSAESIGVTSDLMAGGPVTRAPSREFSLSASRKSSVYEDASLRLNEVEIFAYKVPAKAFS